jgi:galactokinase/mevalonate kinase-like predicted kinase
MQSSSTGHRQINVPHSGDFPDLKGLHLGASSVTLTALLRSMAKPSGFSDGTNWKMASRAWRGSGLLYATARIADILPGSSLSKVP